MKFSGSLSPVMPPLDELPMLTGEAAELVEEAAAAKGKAWRCRLCGHIHRGDSPPEVCPICYFPQSVFVQVWPRATENNAPDLKARE